MTTFTRTAEIDGVEYSVEKDPFTGDLMVVGRMSCENGMHYQHCYKVDADHLYGGFGKDERKALEIGIRAMAQHFENKRNDIEYQRAKRSTTREMWDSIDTPPWATEDADLLMKAETEDRKMKAMLAEEAKQKKQQLDQQQAELEANPLFGMF